MTYSSKAAAQKRAEQLRKQMQGKGWKIRVHENMGWHFNLRLGPVQLHEESMNGKKWYFCLIGTDLVSSGGLAMWTDSEAHQRASSKDPNKCVQHAIEFARAIINMHSDNLKIAEDMLAKAKQTRP
jgi:hypothetical protein